MKSSRPGKACARRDQRRGEWTGLGLDSLGLQGEGMHTLREQANIALIPQQIDLAARLILQLLR